MERPTRNAAVSRLWKKGDGALQLGLPHSCRETGVAAGKQGWLQANRGGCRETGVAVETIPNGIDWPSSNYHSTFIGPSEAILPLLPVFFLLTDRAETIFHVYWLP